MAHLIATIVQRLVMQPRVTHFTLIVISMLVKVASPIEAEIRSFGDTPIQNLYKKVCDSI